jgi:hypothetical protein
MFQNLPETAWTLRDLAILVGAISGPAALIWNIAKLWIDRRAYLRVDLFEGFHAHFEKGTELSYRVEIFNNGPPVTIRNIFLEVRTKSLSRVFSKRVEAIRDDPDDRFPCRIEEGKGFIWEIQLTQSKAKDFLEKGDIYVSVYHSRAKAPIRIKAKDRLGLHAKALNLC